MSSIDTVAASVAEEAKFSSLDWRLILSIWCVLFALAIWVAAGFAWVFLGNELAETQPGTPTFFALHAVWSALTAMNAVLILAGGAVIFVINLEWKYWGRTPNSNH
ncbi:MAG: hypothetical protein SGJ03_07525 [Alphaproteobacteria bacterium]|nr:hypothetical protein [Alphaproteobacteria bacterium]